MRNVECGMKKKEIENSGFLIPNSESVAPLLDISFNLVIISKLAAR